MACWFQWFLRCYHCFLSVCFVSFDHGKFCTRSGVRVECAPSSGSVIGYGFVIVLPLIPYNSPWHFINSASSLL
ncbi:hypothetical protein BS50DRAFT_577094 [Corynespora cassiicola Philippines]|uniref:Uncharacterized protein n=1 Tax=Corynespora cassiicola Philippines TaxID=1448308 RepID=A0A2T2ND19_CORCC|nr:hypothetical protein BS50DRAFT_577094 [Corynespora cassiicola Philippines]